MAHLVLVAQLHHVSIHYLQSATTNHHHVLGHILKASGLRRRWTAARTPHAEVGRYRCRITRITLWLRAHLRLAVRLTGTRRHNWPIEAGMILCNSNTPQQQQHKRCRRTPQEQEPITPQQRHRPNNHHPHTQPLLRGNLNRRHASTWNLPYTSTRTRKLGRGAIYPSNRPRS